jgi:hypothetical protein
MRFSTNSLDASRGVFGINQVASRMFTSAEDLSCCRAFGVTSRGVLEVIDLAICRKLHARGRHTKVSARRNAEDIIVELAEDGWTEPISVRGNPLVSLIWVAVLNRNLDTCNGQGCLRTSQPG